MTRPLVTVNELARVLSLPPSSTYRLVADLARRDAPGVYKCRRSWRLDLPVVLDALKAGPQGDGHLSDR